MLSFDLPWYLWLGFGVFLGLLIGNKKFRDEFDKILGKVTGGKPKKPKELPREDKRTRYRREPEIEEEEDIVQGERRVSTIYRDRRGTHIREIHFDD